MRDEGFLLFRQGHKRIDTRKHEGKVAVKESYPCWCSDVLELACDNRERVLVASALDCCEREFMNWVDTTKGIDAELVGDLMMQASENRCGANAQRPKTIEWLTDNGSSYTASSPWPHRLPTRRGTAWLSAASRCPRTPTLSWRTGPSHKR